ncbi:MAG: ATP-binding protein [Betaproteobacteria bacterium]|jgi:predicted AAA+ superfamily ATPase|nr:ATP-binding protein [Betaproteobacteria bacterium]
MPDIRRAEAGLLRDRLREPRRHMQAVVGPRQVGKTTLVRWALKACRLPFHYVSADDPGSLSEGWLRQQWEIGRVRAAESGRKGAVLAIDELQKLPRWSEQAKRLWDEDTAARRSLRVVVLGSSPLLLQRGMTESLAGRFEAIRVPHWSFGEMRKAFKFDLEHYLVFGGYPGAAPLVHDQARWAAHVRESLIETTLNLDVLQMARVDKPALLRRLFEFACSHSGRQLSYHKMLGQLHDAGNTTTLAHYLRLLESAGMVRGIEKYAGELVRQRASSPKLQVLNNALMTALSGNLPRHLLESPEQRGQLVESAVGAHLANAAAMGQCRLFHWREGDREVDFVIERAGSVIAIEVKSGRRRDGLPGMAAFLRQWPRARPLLVGADGVGIEEFLLKPVQAWFE